MTMDTDGAIPNDQGPRTFDYPFGPGPQNEATPSINKSLAFLLGLTPDTLRAIIREEIEAHERNRYEQGRRAGG